MPQVGYDLEAAKIVEWLVPEGQPVTAGQIVAVVESEKANFEVESPVGGILLKTLYAQGEDGKVLQPIAYVGEAGESIATITPPAPAVAPPPPVAATPAAPPVAVAAAPVHSITQTIPAVQPVKAPAGRVFATPLARAVAREHNIDLRALTGTGMGGRIIKRNVLERIEASTAPALQSAPAPVAAGVEPFSRMRAGIAKRMQHSKQHVPHFYLFADVNVSAVQEWRVWYNQKQDARVTLTDLILKSTAQTLQSFPRLNGYCSNEGVTPAADINLGIAVALEDGLLVPALANVDWLGLKQLSVQSRALVDKARRGMVDPSIRSTFTVSNIGKGAITRFIPIINAPEIAILGVGALEQRVVPARSGIAIADMVTLSLSVDHRAVDGSYAAAFLTELKQTLESYTRD
jgi:pyruvate dehydrogenase E2 component (dihydrolipoamide acetyltransferase)